MKKFKQIKNFVFLSRNNNIFGYKTLNALIKLNKKPNLILLPHYSKKNLRDKLYLKKIFKLNQEKEAIQTLAKLNDINLKRIKSINTSNIIKKLKKEKFDLIFIAGGWPELIKKKIFSIPTFPAINIHPSYLPNFKGGDVHRWQILKNSKTTGVTIHLVNEKFDSGKIILRRKIYLTQKNPVSLSNQLSSIASKMIKKLLDINIDLDYLKKKGNKKNYYYKWNWLDKNFFYVKKNKLHNLESFVNAAFNIPNNFNGPFIKIHNRKIVIRSCAIRNKKLNLFGKNHLITKNYFVLKTMKKHTYCFIKEFQFIDNYKWNKNEIKTKKICNNYLRNFYEGLK